jgi:predicted dehydrogenase
MTRPFALGVIGTRGHIGDVLRGLADVSGVRLVGFSSGGQTESTDGFDRFCLDRGLSVRRYGDWREMVEASGIEGLVVCGPFESHAEQTVAALRRGVSVMAEKPVALTYEELQKIEEALAVAEGRAQLAMMMTYRYEPGFQSAWRLARSGAIGRVRVVEARKSYKLGTRPAYYHDRRTYGGTIPWVGIHAIDWMLWMSGEKVAAVSAWHSSDFNDGNGTLERSAVCQFKLTGGCLGTVTIDYFRPGGAPTHGDDYVRLVGTTGVIEARTDWVQVTDAKGVSTPPVSSDRSMTADWVRSVQRESGYVGLMNSVEMVELNRACLMARESADGDGKVIRVGG